jgi:hypothetical protein
MVQQDAVKQDILTVLNLEDTPFSSCAFAIERSRGVSLSRRLLLNHSIDRKTRCDSTRKRAS